MWEFQKLQIWFWGNLEVNSCRATFQIFSTTIFIIWVNQGRLQNVELTTLVSFFKQIIYHVEGLLAIPNRLAIQNTPPFMIATDSVAFFHL